MDGDTVGMLAQALAGLGVLSKATGQHAESRGHLEEARQLAEELGATKLIVRIDAALGRRSSVTSV